MKGEGQIRRLLLIVVSCVSALCVCVLVYQLWFSQVRILVVNALPSQESDLVLDNDSRWIKVVCRKMEEASGFEDYDAVLMYGRGLYLDSLQLASLSMAQENGVPVFINSRQTSAVVTCHNLDSLQQSRLRAYFDNPCRPNFRNMVRYLGSLASPWRLGNIECADPVILPSDMYYHLEDGIYFKNAGKLTEYLKEKGIYNEGGLRVAFISGIKFPVEGNRAHVDTLIQRLTRSGCNVYPMSASGGRRAEMLREIAPDAIVFMPMGKLGNDSLVNWIYDRKIPLFVPFPLIQTREEWLDKGKAVSGGTLTARVVVPEIDGGMAPLCVSTQNPNDEGYMLYTPEPERVDAFMEQFGRFMRLRTMDNSDKKIAIGYFKSPGKDALLASGMEVIPSLYAFLKRLEKEGYDVTGLPDDEATFGRELMSRGAVMGDYAGAAQKRFMETGKLLWIDRQTYERWAGEVLSPGKYAEVVKRYGKSPGKLLARGDSIAVAVLRYGNVLLFPQPRPALGNDEFKLVHGSDVAPPHSYLAPYLYMQKGFDADVVIHFGTHGNLEFTPGKNVGLSGADWAEALLGNRPHFYFYTTGNVGEAIIAKRRSHAVIVTHLTPPFVESGMRSRYGAMIERLHAALADASRNTPSLKRDIQALGIHKNLGLDSAAGGTYTAEDIAKVDAFIEELANEKVTGAYYVMGRPYSGGDMETSVLAMTADRLAYDRAKRDCDEGKIDKRNLTEHTFIAHHYLPGAREDIRKALHSGIATDEEGLESALRYRDLLQSSAGAEMDAMIGLLSGVPVRPAPGGDPVVNPNVLPMGRNMYSINVESTPDAEAWRKGVGLAEKTLEDYRRKHGEYPRKVAYTFWAGEFITSGGATVAQALRMLGVEPVRDSQGRVVDLKLTPSEELGRPRVDVMVQVSGQLRDIAGARLKMITDAVALAAVAEDEEFPNYVAEGTLRQEKALIEKGEAPRRAKQLASMRVFGPLNSGYSTGMLAYTEKSGEWDSPDELAGGYLNNMSAMYGDDDNWGVPARNALESALDGSDVIVQPRQSNTWGPVSLDHVYEFTGSMSLAAEKTGGKRPDAVMADYRNPYVSRIQDTKEAVAVETRATVLNPEFVRQRMKGDATTAQMFGEIFRNIFGWSATRPDLLTDGIYDELYDMYIADKQGLGIAAYFERVNPAAYQEMTATMLESARKGYWKASEQQIQATAGCHARMTEKFGAPCTEFVCANRKLHDYIASHLDKAAAQRFASDMSAAVSANGDSQVLREDVGNTGDTERRSHDALLATVILICLVSAVAVYVNYRKRRKNE